MAQLLRNLGYKNPKHKFMMGVMWLLLLVACSPKADEQTTRISSLDRDEILALINAVRAKGCQCGDMYYEPTTALTWNDQLEVAAQNQSDYMLYVGKATHTGFNGSEVIDRVDATGYLWQTLGENVASGFSDTETVIDAFFGSPDHCKNLMESRFTEIGMAQSGIYWAQVFALPRSGE